MVRVAIVVLAVLTLALAAGTAGAWTVRGPADPRYAMDLAVSADGALTGTMSADVRNAGPGALRRVWLRLWANGPGGCARPRITVQVTAGGAAGPLRVGCTALPVDLARPIAPGSRARIGLAFRVVAPRTARRFGRSGGGLLFGNAIPLVAVTRPDGPDLDPYIALGDPFFSLTARWRVRLALPAGWTAGTTGHAVARSPRSGGGMRLTIRAARARDFAIAAGPYRVHTASEGGVRVRYLAAPGSGDGRSRRMLAAARRALRAFTAWYGPYRSAELDVVETPTLASEGMEYPGMVMSEPVGGTVVHEVGHQWWYAQVGSDGWRAPWLDETLTTYSQLRLTGDLARCDLAAPFAGYGDARLTWTLGRLSRAPEDYGAVYDGGACALEWLRRRWGTERVDRMLRGYQAAHMDGVAVTADLVGAIRRAAPAGFDVAAFLAYARIGPVS